MIAALARAPLARLARVRRAWLPIVGWAVLGLVAAVVARRTGAGDSADHALRGTFGPVVLPLLSYAVVGALLGGEGLRPSLRGVVALGAAPARAALATVLVAIGASAIAAALVGAAVDVLGHGPGDLPLARDLPITLGVALLGGSAYGAWFVLASALGRGGAMRGFFLFVDWVLGSPLGVVAVLVPRGHLLALLGAGACGGLPRSVSSVVLVALTVLAAALAVRLGRR